MNREDILLGMALKYQTIDQIWDNLIVSLTIVVIQYIVSLKCIKLCKNKCELIVMQDPPSNFHKRVYVPIQFKPSKFSINWKLFDSFRSPR